ncbi:hypothetical protein Ciccas_008192 [Cichlidogyrus casuarinus]|uniref:Uncharacterized protein n=1 Tax=Cichlidogyrus casuarinus TaxID=1844966 RepID=A0ABD2Q100_9PLAT
MIFHSSIRLWRRGDTLDREFNPDREISHAIYVRSSTMVNAGSAIYEAENKFDWVTAHVLVRYPITRVTVRCQNVIAGT